MPQKIVPTYVGVYRKFQEDFFYFLDCPHVCGGVPVLRGKKNMSDLLSPRMWGCTETWAVSKIWKQFGHNFTVWSVWIKNKEEIVPYKILANYRFKLGWIIIPKIINSFLILKLFSFIH